MSSVISTHAQPILMLSSDRWLSPSGVLLPAVCAQGQSTFVSGEGDGNLTVAVTIPSPQTSPNTDLLFYISGPKDFSWIGEAHGPLVKKFD